MNLDLLLGLGAVGLMLLFFTGTVALMYYVLSRIMR